MKVIEVRNVNQAVAEALPFVLQEGIPEESRNGKVLVAPAPVMTVYKRPLERVLFSPVRDANPFFHLMESMWMLAGRIDLALPRFFNSRFDSFSDDGENVHGAYGFRWRNWFGFDQIDVIVDYLRKDPTGRRAVLSMWAPTGDLVAFDRNEDFIMIPTFSDGVGGMKSKDVPCNTHAYFDVRGGKLNMTVCNRSNDIIWGAYGANAVHFSFLLEYMALALDVQVGVYRQFSNNFHAYTDVYNEEKLWEISRDAAATDFYSDGLSASTMDRVVKYKPLHVPLAVSGHKGIQAFNDQLSFFLENPVKMLSLKSSFLTDVAQPMYMAWAERKQKLSDGHQWIDKMPECDWKLACTMWMARRDERKN